MFNLLAQQITITDDALTMRYYYFITSYFLLKKGNNSEFERSFCFDKRVQKIEAVVKEARGCMALHNLAATYVIIILLIILYARLVILPASM